MYVQYLELNNPHPLDFVVFTLFISSVPTVMLQLGTITLEEDRSFNFPSKVVNLFTL